ncbi:MAG: deoxyhypusine synthase [Halobacteriota archaeon]|nr:deoxyhypusine synthase [Halobacteriota archaeon]
MNNDFPVREIEHAKITAGMSADDLINAMSGCGLGAGRIAEAVDVYEEMVNEGATKFFGLSGAMVPAGMRQIVSDMIRDGYIDVLVTTGANLVHDLIESLGGHHYRGSDKVDDLELRDRQINRIFDVFLPEQHFTEMEEHMLAVLDKMDQKFTIREFTAGIGKSVDDPNSILRSAFDCDVPIFCPAISDSIIGLNTWLYKQTNELNVDVFDDLKDIIDICYNAEKTGVIILGGGVPKNFILQSMLVSMKGGFDYFIQITTDRPDSGGLSGATPDEAKSWTKVKEEAKAVTVYSDATIALPLMMAAVRERLD